MNFDNARFIQVGTEIARSVYRAIRGWAQEERTREEGCFLSATLAAFRREEGRGRRWWLKKGGRFVLLGISHELWRFMCLITMAGEEKEEREE